jgi:hypothetical protein
LKSREQNLEHTRACSKQLVCNTKLLTIELAATIAIRSPVAVEGSKKSLKFRRDHTSEVGLEQRYLEYGHGVRR